MNKGITKSDNTPTRGQNGIILTRPDGKPLTAKQKAVFEVVCSPEHWKRTETEQMKIAGCGRTRFYQIMGDPWFVEAVSQFARFMVGSRLARLYAASLETAEQPGREGFQDRRLLFGLTGELERSRGELARQEESAEAVPGEATEVDERAEIQQAIDWISEAREQLQTDSIAELLKHMEILRDKAQEKAGAQGREGDNEPNAI